jgi:hypothetical protein
MTGMNLHGVKPCLYGQGSRSPEVFRYPVDFFLGHFPTKGAAEGAEFAGSTKGSAFDDRLV